MDYTNLQVLAEVSVTLLGFSGLTAVIGYSRFDQRGIEYRTLLLLYASSVAFIGSIMPLVGVPVLFASIGIAVSMLVEMVWAGNRMWGKSVATAKTSPLFIWTLFPMFMISTFALWWSIISLAEKLLLIYELSIGLHLLLATVSFVRLVRSAFVTNGISGKE